MDTSLGLWDNATHRPSLVMLATLKLTKSFNTRNNGSMQKWDMRASSSQMSPRR